MLKDRHKLQVGNTLETTSRDKSERSNMVIMDGPESGRSIEREKYEFYSFQVNKISREFHSAFHQFFFNFIRNQCVIFS